jgi:hypothetical protein
MAVMSIVGVNFFLLHGPAPNRVVGGLATHREGLLQRVGHDLRGAGREH